jgi:hypothetical protein
MEEVMFMTLLVALGALLLAVLGRAALDPDTRGTDYRQPPMIGTAIQPSCKI